MIDHATAVQGGYKCLLEEAMPTNSSSTNVFANAPVGTRFITMTVLTGTLWLTFDGVTVPVASSKGTPFASLLPYDLPLAQDLAKIAKGIGGATGWLAYFGVP